MCLFPASKRKTPSKPKTVDSSLPSGLSTWPLQNLRWEFIFHLQIIWCSLRCTCFCQLQKHCIITCCTVHFLNNQLLRWTKSSLILFKDLYENMLKISDTPRQNCKIVPNHCFLLCKVVENILVFLYVSSGLQLNLYVAFIFAYLKLHMVFSNSETAERRWSQTQKQPDRRGPESSPATSCNRTTRLQESRLVPPGWSRILPRSFTSDC